jgi:hypothetical protein
MHPTARAGRFLPRAIAVSSPPGRGTIALNKLINHVDQMLTAAQAVEGGAVI